MNKEISAKRRLGSMLLDHAFLCFILIFLILVIKFLLGYNNDSFYSLSPYYFFPIWVLYLNKDIVAGRSLAKRILGLQIILEKTNSGALPWKCFVRNIPIIIWPIETVISYYNRQKRIGDLLAGTKLVYFDISRNSPKPTFIQIACSIIGSSAVGIFVTFLYTLL